MKNISQFEKCAWECLHCHSVCAETIAYCLSKNYSNLAHLLAECMQICKTAAGFLLLDSGFRNHTCEECADICELVIKEAEKFKEGDNQILSCIKACKQCAESCHKVYLTSHTIERRLT